MSYLIKDTGNGSAEVLHSGGTNACELKGAQLWAGGDHGPLVVMCDRRGKVKTFSGDYAELVRRRNASKEAQKKSVTQKNAEADLAAKQGAKAKAESDLEKAKQRAVEAGADAAKAELKVSPTPSKQAKKKTPKGKF